MGKLRFESTYGPIGRGSMDFVFHATDAGRQLRLLVDQDDLADMLRVPGSGNVESVIHSSILTVQSELQKAYDALPEEAKSADDIRL